MGIQFWKHRMQAVVTLRAKPNNIERPRVIFVMTMNVFVGTANRTRPLCQLPIAQRVTYCGLRPIRFGIFFSPRHGNLPIASATIRTARTFTLTLLNPRIGQPQLPHAFFVAIFATRGHARIKVRRPVAPACVALVFHDTTALTKKAPRRPSRTRCACGRRRPTSRHRQ